MAIKFPENTAQKERNKAYAEAAEKHRQSIYNCEHPLMFAVAQLVEQASIVEGDNIEAQADMIIRHVIQTINKAATDYTKQASEPYQKMMGELEELSDVSITQALNKLYADTKYVSNFRRGEAWNYGIKQLHQKHFPENKS